MKLYFFFFFLGYYFIKDGNNKNPKGKLYAKYYNSTRMLKTSGLSNKRKLKFHTQRRHDNEFGKIFFM